MAQKKVSFIDQQPVEPISKPTLKFDSFIQVIRVIGDFSGAVHYDEQQQGKATARVTFKRIFFWISYVHTLLCVTLEIIYFAEAVQKGAALAHLLVLGLCIGSLIYAILKLGVQKFYEVQLNEILIMLKDLYPELLDVKTLNRYRKHIWFLKMFFVLYILTLLTFNVIYYAPSIADFIKTGRWEKILPFYLKYWYDWRQPVVFELTFLHQVWVSSSVMLGSLLTDTLYCIIILLLSMQFEVLGKRLEKSEKDEQELVKCIEKHLQLINIYKRFKRIYSPSLLVTFLGSSGIICCSLFLTIAGENMGEKIRFAVMLLVYLMTNYLLCYYGSMLMEKSSSIANHVYQGQWYSSCKIYKKTCLMILIRGQREAKMTALKFATISLPCFRRILNTAFSYFTLLMAVYERS